MADIRLTAAEREWIAVTILDAAVERDADRAARLIEARVETLIRGRIEPVLALADAWDREAASLGRSLSELMLRDGARQVRAVVSPPDPEADR